MKTLEAEEGKYLGLKPCKNWMPPLIIGSTEAVDYYTKICPCSNHAGEIQRNNDKITRFSCENGVISQPPTSKIKPKVPRGTLERRS